MPFTDARTEQTNENIMVRTQSKVRMGATSGKKGRRLKSAGGTKRASRPPGMFYVHPFGNYLLGSAVFQGPF